MHVLVLEPVLETQVATSKPSSLFLCPVCPRGTRRANWYWVHPGLQPIIHPARYF